MQHGARIPLDREIHDRTRAQHEDDVRIDIREAVKHPPLCRRQRQRLSVQALGLCHLVEAAAENHTGGFPRELQRVPQPFGRLPLAVISVSRIAARRSDELSAEALRELPRERLDPPAVHERGTRALIARHESKVPDQCDRLRSGERQYAVVL